MSSYHISTTAIFIRGRLAGTTWGYALCKKMFLGQSIHFNFFQNAWILSMLTILICMKQVTCVTLLRWILIILILILIIKINLFFGSKLPYMRNIYGLFNGYQRQTYISNGLNSNGFTFKSFWTNMMPKKIYVNQLYQTRENRFEYYKCMASPYFNGIKMCLIAVQWNSYF